MRSRREHKNRGRQIALYGAGILCVGALFFVFSPPAFFRTSALSFAKPFWFISGRVESSFEGTRELFRSKQSLAEENTRLKNSVAELTARNKTVAALAATNESLSDLLRKKTNERQILAGVLSGPPESPYDTFLIDAGKRDGVNLHDQVVAYGDIAIGTISYVGNRTSEVALYSSPNSETRAILLAATSSIAVTISGQGAGNFLVKLPRGVQVATDSPIVLPGTQTILIASVGSVIEKPAEAFETVLAVSPFTLQGLRFVEILPAVHEQ